MLAGERGADPIRGFDLGNSPGEMTAAAVAGRLLVMTTTNGTKALRAVAGAASVHPLAAVNFSVAVHRLRSPAATVLFGDSRGGDDKHGKHSYALDPPRLAVVKNATRFGPGSGDVSSGLNSVRFAFSPVEMRHRGRGEVVFADAHGESMTLKKLGYEIGDQGVATPVIPVEGQVPTASNKLWTGLGVDPLQNVNAR